MRRLLLVGSLCAVIAASIAAWADGLTVPFSMPATTCSNQFVRSLAAATGAGTCATVVNADLATMTTSTIKGQTVGGSGVPVDLTAAQAAAVIGTVGGAQLSKLISTTRDLTAATGTQAITGAGFTPTACLFFTAVNGTTASSFGLSDSARTAGSVQTTTDGAATWAWGAGANAIQISNNAGSAFQTATVQSYDADGLTLSWTKTGSPTGTLQMKLLCLR